MEGMTRVFRYLSHPQVCIDPDIPVPDWRLSEKGVQRTQAFSRSELLQDTRSISSSAERKAVDTATILAAKCRLDVFVREGTHENDRSATGFLEPEAFETVANQFFAAPNESVRGWERAADAQNRIVTEAMRVIKHAPDGDILMVGHGGVGTLLFCYLAGLEIDRAHDQPAGGGNVFAYDLEQDSILHAWRPMESLLDS